jgi:hypothetical protein
MYNQPMTQLDPATQALAQAVQVLKQRSNPTTPNGQPTIAGQAMQAAQAQMQPPMPPQGIMQPPQGGQPQSQGIMGAAQNAATGAAIQQMQQQQAQEAMMAMAQQQQAQQQPPQGMAAGGVARLHAGNMGFKEGGIIPAVGYAGGGGIDLSKLYGSEPLAASYGITGALPAEPESSEVAEMRMRQAERAALDKQRIAELYARGTEATKNSDAAADAAQKEALKERYFERLLAVTGAGAQSRYGAGEGYLNFQNAARKADALYAQQKQLNAMQQLEQDKYRYSLEAGSNTAAQDALKNIAGIKDKLADNALQIRQLAETARGNDLRATVDREQIAAGDARSEADREGRRLESGAKIAADKYIAGLGLDRAEKAQNIKLFLNDMNSVEMKKLQEQVASAKRNKSPDAPALEKRLSDKRTSYAKYYKLTPQDVASAYEYAGASASAGAGGPAEFKYNPKTGKVE